MRPLVLASASAARLRLLQQAGFDPTVLVSDVDEDTIISAEQAGISAEQAGISAEQAGTAPDPHALVRQLAEAKAHAVVPRAPAGALVVGCDSMLCFGEQVLGKPRTASEATERWRAMRGGEGALLTGHCIIDTASGRAASAVASTVVRFGTPTDDEIAAYVATGEPLAVAGAFTLDGRSAPFIDAIDGDHGNVIGLSLPLFRALLREVGVEVTSLWA